jgi:hypothetical protein
MSAQNAPRPGKRPTHQVPGKNREALIRWLEQRCRTQIAAHDTPIDKIRAIRTSSETVTMWQASARTSFAAADRSDPDVANALALGFDLIRRDAIGETLRCQLGESVFVLRMHHVRGGIGARQMGIVLHVNTTFFVYLLGTARKGNLYAETADRRGNATTEVLSTITRTMWRAGQGHDDAYRPHVYAREHDRIVRDERHGADLKATFTSCRVIAHTPHTTDLTNPAQAQTFSFGSMISAAAADATIRGMNRSEILIQAGGGFYENMSIVPFTHGPRVLVERDSRTGTEVVSVDRHRLAVVQDAAGAKRNLRRLVDQILADGRLGRRGDPVADWDAVGDLMAEMGLPARLPRYAKKKIMLSQLPTRARAHAARSLFDEPWVSGWRDGAYDKLVPIKISMELDLSDLGVEQVKTESGQDAYRCRIQMPTPEDGWGVSDAEWEEVLRRRRPDRDEERKYTGTVLPLAGLPEWQDDQCQFDVTTGTQVYLLRARPLDEALSDGIHAGWEASTVTSVATIRPHEWHADVARAMREALLAFEAETLPVTITPTRRDMAAADCRTTSRVQAARLAEIEGRLTQASNQLEGAVDEKNELRGRLRGRTGTPGEQEEFAEVEQALGRARARVASLKADLGALMAPPPPMAVVSLTDSAVAVITATAEFVTVSLEKCTYGAPGWLNEACSQLLTDVTLRPVHDPGHRPAVAWSATLTLLTIGKDGEQEMAGIPISGEVFDRANAKNGRVVSSGPEAWAWSFFYCGASFKQIGADGGVDGSGKKNSYLYKGLEEWLRGAVPDVTLRTAALDLPIPAARRVLWHAVTGDSLALLGVSEGFTTHMHDTYAGRALTRAWGWCRDTHRLARDVAELLLGAGGALCLSELAEQLGVAPLDIAALARVNGKSTRAGQAAKPAKLAVSPFEKSWGRGEPWRPAEDRRISLRECPHPDCPERMRGGTPFASHILWVPETEAGHGVLCPSCRRLPVAAKSTVYFPAAYLRPWSGRFGRNSHAIARDQPGTHIDVTLTDPGPGDALPDTGTTARDETRVNRPGTYVPASLLVLPLRGRRVLPLGLSEVQHADLARSLTGLGGRLGQKIKASLACVVVPNEEGLTSPKAQQAAGLGVEVITWAQFATRSVNAWRSLGTEPAA